MINLFEKDKRSEKKMEKIRMVVWPISTAVLVGYLLLSSGLLGWWWWWNSKQKVTNTEAENLKRQLLNPEQLEKVMYLDRISDRVKYIDDYLTGRVNWDKDLEFVQDQNIAITKWKLNKGGIVEMTVSASSSAELDQYTRRLIEGYGSVNLNSIIWKSGDGQWQAEISMDKRKL